MENLPDFSAVSLFGVKMIMWPFCTPKEDMAKKYLQGIAYQSGRSKHGRWAAWNKCTQVLGTSQSPILLNSIRCYPSPSLNSKQHMLHLQNIWAYALSHDAAHNFASNIMESFEHVLYLWGASNGKPVNLLSQNIWKALGVEQG